MEVGLLQTRLKKVRDPSKQLLPLCLLSIGLRSFYLQQNCVFNCSLDRTLNNHGNTLLHISLRDFIRKFPSVKETLW